MAWETIHMLKTVLGLSLGLALGACATTAGVAPKVDLTPAREAVETARKAGASERAPETFTRAQGHLSEAESLAAAQGTQPRDRALQAESLARLAVAEAQCAAAMAKLGEPQAAAQQAAAATTVEVEKLASKLRKAEDDQHRLEDKIGVLQRDLEMTETEIIRTKARLKGTETKAEASSAIAEARILMRRLSDEKKTASLARCQELIAKAEQLLKEDNYGAAAFFAFKAQDTAIKAQETPSTEGPEVSPPQKRYVVKAAVANIRKGPGTAEPIVATAPQGASLEALALRGEWLKVGFGKVTGWVHRSLVQ